MSDSKNFSSGGYPVSRDRRFERWWTTEGKQFAARWGARFTASIAWSNGAYIASDGEKPVDYRRMKKTPPDRPGLWAYRVAGAGRSVNVAVTRGTEGLFLHHANGSIYSINRWVQLYPKIRWKQIA